MKYTVQKVTHYQKRNQPIALVSKMVQILELSNRDFKTTQINTLKNTVKNMQ